MAQVVRRLTDWHAPNVPPPLPGWWEVTSIEPGMRAFCHYAGQRRWASVIHLQGNEKLPEAPKTHWFASHVWRGHAEPS